MSLYDQMRERREAVKAELLAILTAAENAEGGARSLTADEDATYSAKNEELRQIDARIHELQEIEERQAAADKFRAPVTASLQVNEPDIYTKEGRNGYWTDLYHVTKHNDPAARERLTRHAAREAAETRAVGNTNAAGGSGGEWAPPTWLVGDWINLIRPARVTANLFSHEDIPFGTSSLNYPKLTGGTTVALQSTQNSALSSTDPTTGFVQTGFSTLGGKIVASQQILDQGRNFDQVITRDLAAAYAQQVGTQVFTGTGTGSGTNSVINGLGAATIGSTQTWTQASPTAGGFYGQTAALLQKFLSARLMNPNCFVMHPRRWYWMESSLDSTGRPFVVPSGNAYNPLAIEANGPVAAGYVGTMHGLPVVIDPLVPTNLGAGTNQDIVYLLKTDDLVLLESPPQAEVFREPYADSMGVLFRLYAYVGTILNRHTESIGVLTGTGLVPPTFAS
jgi:HK97 family phage major capsid protein